MPFVIILSWVTSTVAGHTKVSYVCISSKLQYLVIHKKTTTNGIFLVGYALGQILCTQFWKQQYRPLDSVPWGIALVSFNSEVLAYLGFLMCYSGILDNVDHHRFRYSVCFVI